MIKGVKIYVHKYIVFIVKVANAIKNSTERKFQNNSKI